MNDKNVGNELADIKSETLCLSEQKKSDKNKKNKFSSKIIGHKKHIIQ